MAHEAAPRPGSARRPRIVGRSRDHATLAGAQPPSQTTLPAPQLHWDETVATDHDLTDAGHGIGADHIADHMESLTIDCDRCAVRGHGCGDCMVTVLLGGPPVGVELDDEERRAISVLVDAGLVPPLRMVVPLDTAHVPPGGIT